MGQTIRAAADITGQGTVQIPTCAHAAGYFGPFTQMVGAPWHCLAKIRGPHGAGRMVGCSSSEA
eukprot:4220167-Pyramimonas_sp.AAC.1